MKHYYVTSRAAGSGARPWLFFDVKFDIRDVRSSTSETLERSFQVEMIPLDDDLIWTPDMVIEHSGNFLGANTRPIETPPELSGSFTQERAETKFLEYLLRHHRIVVHRNPSCELYSAPSEPLDDFRARCHDRVAQEMSGDLRVLADRYVRRLLQIEESLNRACEGLDSDAEEMDSGAEELLRARLDLSRVFSELKEGISVLSLDHNLEDMLLRPVPFNSLPEALRIREKLEALQRELLSDLTQLQQSYRRRAESVEPFSLTLTLHQIDIVGTAILWQ